MKTIVSTPTRKTTLNTPWGALIRRALPFQRRFHSFFQLGTGGSFFGFFVLVGAIQPKEVMIKKPGQHTHATLNSNSQFNFFKKEF